MTDKIKDQVNKLPPAPDSLKALMGDAWDGKRTKPAPEPKRTKPPAGIRKTKTSI